MLSKFPCVARGCRSLASRKGTSGNRGVFEQACAARLASTTTDSKYQLNQLSHAEFMKLIRKPPEFFDQVIEGVKHDLSQIPSVEGDAKLKEMLTPAELKHMRDTIFANMGYSKPIANNFLKSACGLPQMGASIYSHMWIGIVNYILKKKGLDPSKASDEQVNEAVRLVTYYRSPLLVEEMTRLGYSHDQINEVNTKAFFMQYWSGDHAKDPLFFNPMTRAFYPCDKHITTGGGDLGREQEFQSSRLFALGHEEKEAPLTIINAGDTLAFTDGAMSMLQHLIEASERGMKIPIIFLINSNNSSISSRIAGDGDNLTSSAAAVKKIEERLAHWGKVMGPGFVTQATDPASGVKAMRDAVDQVLETGKPTYVISAFPFRPVGHASDASPASDELLSAQFESFRKTIVNQIAATAAPGTTGAELAEALDSANKDIERHTLRALAGNKILNRHESEELSVPGITAIKADPGHIIDVPSGYLLGKGIKAFAGMGADIYGKSFNKMFTENEEAGRQTRYIHQENHKPNQTDTRGGVYGELNGISKHHLETKFVNLLPNEAQIAQLGGGFRAALAKDDVVIVKGPHTLFNEHAKSFLKYAAYRHCDTRENVGFVYLMDGYNIAGREREIITTADGAEVERDMILARVGEHHNSPYYAGYTADPNTVCAAPLDMNVFSAMLPEMVRLSGDHRMVLGFLPTKTFGVLHPEFSKGPVPAGRGITQNDVLRVSFSGQAPKNGKNLVVLAYGPDSTWIAQTLSAQNIQCDLIILNYLAVPNSLLAYLDDYARAGAATEVVAVDPNPGAQVMAPLMAQIKNALGYPQALHFSDCTTTPTFVPWGYGGTLLGGSDLLNVLSMRSIIDGQGMEGRSAVVRASASSAAPSSSAAAAPKGAAASGAEEVVKAPMDGENVVVTYKVKIGDQVRADDVIAEIESDKATVEVTASTAGTVTKFFVEENKEMNVTTDTDICTIAEGAGAAPAGAKGEEETVKAPMDGENVVVTFKVKVGDQVAADDVLAEIESDKATVEVTASSAGKVTKFFVAENKEMNVTTDTDICSIEAGAAGAAPAQDAKVGVGANYVHFENVSTQARSLSAEEVVPLSRVQIAMVDNMTVKVGDTMTYTVGESIDFRKVTELSKEHGVSPTTSMVKVLADSVQSLKLNKKLSTDKRSTRVFKGADIGMAVEVGGQLRVAVIRDAAKKTLQEIAADIENFKAKGAKLAPEDQDLDSVCFVLTSLGKAAPSLAYATLPRGVTGILAIGRMAEGRSNFTFTLCHATLTGSEGAGLMSELVKRSEGR